MAKSSNELIRDLQRQCDVLTERDTNRQEELEDVKADLKEEQAERRAVEQKHRDEIAQLRQELAAAHQEHAVLKQQFQDHLAQYQEWDKRKWAIFGIVIGAACALASNLIVSLTRK